MALNISKGNMYEFVTHTWNAIKGACPHDCTYCYMKRFGTLKPVRLDQKELKTDLGKGNFIFVGSSCDMFACGIDVTWMEKVLAHCLNFPENKYLFQSKNPHSFHAIQNLDAVLCTTIETNRFYKDIMRNSPSPNTRAHNMRIISKRKFVTIEPIMDFDLDEMVELIKICGPEQVNIGADSGAHALPEPPIEKVLELIDALSAFTKIEKKRNLERLMKK